MASFCGHVYQFMRNGSDTAYLVYFLTNQIARLSFAEIGVPVEPLWRFVYVFRKRGVFQRSAEAGVPAVLRALIVYFFTDRFLWTFSAVFGVPPVLPKWIVLICFWPGFGVFSFLIWCALHHLLFIPPGGSSICWLLPKFSILFFR